MFLADVIEPLLMVICSLVSLISEYGIVFVTVLDGLLMHQSLWHCTGWMRASLGCLIAYLKLWYSFCFSSWSLCGIHGMEPCLCVKCDGDFL